MSNLGRGLNISLFGLLLNYVLIHYSTIEILNSYVHFISVFSLFYVFINWGGKFFNTKEISKNPNRSKDLISNLISSKLILLVFFGSFLVLLPIKLELKLLTFLFLFLKSLVPIFDSLIIFRKKSQFVLAVEFILNSLFLSILYFSTTPFNPFIFLLSFVVLEFIKSLFYVILFWTEISFRFSITKGFNVLKKSFYFFGLSIAGFAASKADFYIIGILADKKTMSNYFILSSLLSISMIIYATLINSFEISIYRFNKVLFIKLENMLKYFGFLFSIIVTVVFYISSNYIYNIPIDFCFSLLYFINVFLFTLLNFEMYRYTKFDKQIKILVFLVISAVFNCIFSLLLIKQFHLFGAFLANTIGLLINYLLLRLYFIKK